VTVRDVVIYPDARLKTVCASMEAASLSRDVVAVLARDLLDTMSSFPGCVGIAAPQIGELVRMVAIDVTGAKRAVSCHGELVLVDPVLVASSGSVTMREGCLSIPDFTGNVRRAELVTVARDDRRRHPGRARVRCLRGARAAARARPPRRVALPRPGQLGEGDLPAQAVSVTESPKRSPNLWYA